MVVNQAVFALLGGIAFLFLIALVFWPEKGLLALISNSRLNSRRILLEDALKYLFDCEYKGLSCRLNALAGNLHISTDRTTRLLESLRQMGLIILEKDRIKLSDLGRSYALRVYGYTGYGSVIWRMKRVPTIWNGMVWRISKNMRLPLRQRTSLPPRWAIRYLIRTETPFLQAPANCRITVEYL